MSLNDELVGQINALEELADPTRIEVYEKLSKIFSLIPVRVFAIGDKRAKAPLYRKWQMACYNKFEFSAINYINNNAGIAGGPASGVLVLDIDDIALFQEYLSNNNISSEFKNTFTVKTGSGGTHYYFKYPSDGCVYGKYQYSKKMIIGGEEKKVVGFDIVGVGSQVVAPGSMHPETFKFYKIKHNLPFSDAPDWILKLCLKINHAPSLGYDLNPNGIEPDEVNLKYIFAGNTQDLPQFEDSEEDSAIAIVKGQFKCHFDNCIQWGVSKVLDRIGPPTQAFRESNYLMFPKSRRAYMCFDLDYPNAAESWRDKKLPEPTISITNPANGHALLAYELERPVVWKTDQNRGRVLAKPIAYFRAIRFAFDQVLNADNGYTHVSMKNPFSPQWVTRWSDKIYSLKDLQKYVILPSAKDIYEKFYKDIFAGRDEELFIIARRWCFANVRKYLDYDSFREKLFKYLDWYNTSKIPEHWPTRGPLEQYVVKTKSENVSQWVWIKKDDKKYSKVIKNYGLMNLEPIPSGLSPQELLKHQRRNQSLGAYKTHELNRLNTDSIIISAIDMIYVKGKNVKDVDIERVSKKSINTIRSRREFINSYLSGLELFM